MCAILLHLTARNAVKKTEFYAFFLFRALLFAHSLHVSTRNTANRLKQAFPTWPRKKITAFKKKQFHQNIQNIIFEYMFEKHLKIIVRYSQVIRRSRRIPQQSGSKIGGIPQSHGPGPPFTRPIWFCWSNLLTIVAAAVTALQVDRWRHIAALSWTQMEVSISLPNI